MYAPSSAAQTVSITDQLWLQGLVRVVAIIFSSSQQLGSSCNTIGSARRTIFVEEGLAGSAYIAGRGASAVNVANSPTEL